MSYRALIQTNQKAEKNIYINKIRNEKQDKTTYITTDADEILRIILGHTTKICTSKNWKIWINSNFLDKYHIPELNLDQVSKLNKPINIKDIDAILKKPLND